jgi:hypothetical protein
MLIACPLSERIVAFEVRETLPVSFLTPIPPFGGSFTMMTLLDNCVKENQLLLY